MTSLNSLSKTIKKPTVGDRESAPVISRMALLVMISVLLSSTSVFLAFVNILYTRSITQKQFPTLVQTASGEAIEIGFEAPNYRSPETIQKFVSDTLYYLMTMTSYGPGDGQVSMLDPTRQKAPSMKIDGGEITQSAWLASESLEGKFADTFKQQLAEMTPKTVFQGTEEVILKFNYIEQPEPIEGKDGYWSVDVIAELKVFKLGGQMGNITTDTVPFNKVVTVRAVNSPPVHSVEDFGDLAVALNQIQLAGLQITDIKDLSVMR
ncbi:MAG: hypothetical protein AAF810_08765 [Cyanobacteria bacterium P01_D01_bin.36]